MTILFMNQSLIKFIIQACIKLTEPPVQGTMS